MSTISVEAVNEMVEIVALLIKEGVTFRVSREMGGWIIKLSEELLW